MIGYGVFSVVLRLSQRDLNIVVSGHELVEADLGGSLHALAGASHTRADLDVGRRRRNFARLWLILYL